MRRATRERQVLPAMITTTAATSQRASRTPQIAPSAESSRLSVSSCATSLPRVAPSAMRTVISPCRAAARDSSRLPTFAHAISSTSATTASRMWRGSEYRKRRPDTPAAPSASSIRESLICLMRASDGFAPAALVRNWRSDAVAAACAWARVAPLERRPIRLSQYVSPRSSVDGSARSAAERPAAPRSPAAGARARRRTPSA